MRSPTADLLVPPYCDELYPYRAYPPWQALAKVCGLLGAATARRGMPTHFKFIEVALIQASQRIVAVALGELPPFRWYRRARAALHRLEQAKLAIVDYVAAGALELEEAKEMVDGIDATIASLVDEVARVPLPDEVRARLPDLTTAWPSVH